MCEKIKSYYNVKSLADFLACIKLLCSSEFSVIYRGQRNASWEIESCSYRELSSPNQRGTHDGPSSEAIYKFQQKLLREYRQQGIVDGDDLPLLARLQHGEAKTNLLDYSKNPLAALWFACVDLSEKNESKKEKSNGAVYCLPTVCVQRYIQEVDHTDSLKNIFEGKVTPLACKGQLEQSDERKPLSVSPSNPMSPPIYFYEPPQIDQRIINQQSVFSFSLGGTIPRHRHTIIEIQETDKAGILNDLDMIGISAKTLFPDMPGLAKWFQYTKEAQLKDCMAEIAQLIDNKVGSYNILSTKHGPFSRKEEFTFEKAKKLCTELYGASSSQMAEIYQQIGIKLSLQNEHKNAAGAYQEAVNILSKKYVENHIKLAEIYFSSAVANLNSSCLEDASNSCKQSLQIYKKLAGDKSFEVAEMYILLGAIHLKKQKTGPAINSNFGAENPDAQSDFGTSLAIYKELTGNESVETADALYRISDYHPFGLKDHALKYLEQALAIQKKLLDQDDFRLLETHYAIGDIMRWNPFSQQQEDARKKTLNHFKMVIQPLSTKPSLLMEEMEILILSCYRAAMLLYTLPERSAETERYLQQALDLQCKLDPNNFKRLARIKDMLES